MFTLVACGSVHIDNPFAAGGESSTDGAGVTTTTDTVPPTYAGAPLPADIVLYGAPATELGFAVTPADVDGDGAVDAVVAAGGTSILRGLLVADRDLATAAATYEQSEAAPGDLDGVVDLAFPDGLSASIFRGPLGGDHTRSEQDTTVGDGAAVGGVAVGDVTGDGQDDLAFVDVFSDPTAATVFAGPLTGDEVALDAGFDVVLDGNEAPSSWVSVSTGDLTGDGVGDLLATSHDAGANDGHVWLAAGPVGAGDALEPLADAQAFQAVPLGDVDGDGNVDFAAPSTGLSPLARVWSADGREIATADDTGGRYDLSEVALGDIDGDGAADLAGRTEGGPILIWYSPPAAWSQADRVIERGVADAFFLEPGTIALADADGDGRADLWCANGRDPTGTGTGEAAWILFAGAGDL